MNARSGSGELLQLMSITASEPAYRAMTPYPVDTGVDIERSLIEDSQVTRLQSGNDNSASISIDIAEYIQYRMRPRS